MSRKRKSKEKSKLRIWAEFIPFWLFFKTIRMIPIKVSYKISSVIFLLMFKYFDRKHSKRTVQHLLHTKVAKDTQEAIEIAKRTYQNFSMLLVEIFKMDQIINLDNISVTGSQSAIDAACQKGSSDNINVIIVTAHYGNWELAGSGWAHNFNIPMVSIMRRFGNPLIGECILKSRTSDIHECVEKEGGIKGLLKALRKGKTIAILADQHASTREGGIVTEFFGHPCRTHTSPAILHLKTGVPILPEITRRKPDGKGFEFVVGDLIRYTPTGDKEADIKAVTQMYTTALEKLIGEQPDQWLWAHRRWLNINRRGWKSE
jgi:KDO2-lipid IV(A) lauroyltransferase